MDGFIGEVSALVARARDRGTPVRVFEEAASPAASFPIRVGPGASPGVILRSDTFLELGNPEAGSTDLLLATDTPSLVRGGRVTLVGPDIPESEGRSLPFGQVVMVRGTGCAFEDLRGLLVVGQQIEGYMTRGGAGNVWSRVSRGGVARGLTFEVLGRALMSLLRAGQPDLEAIEVLFVTSARDDVAALEPMARQVRDMRREEMREHWRSQGYDVDCHLDCSSCEDQQVCDDIRSAVRQAPERERQES